MVMHQIDLLFSVLPKQFAYLDPGSGSFLLQLLLATLLGALFLLRSSWGKIKSFFSRLFSRQDDEEE
jgi:hypothetical protein